MVVARSVGWSLSTSLVAAGLLAAGIGAGPGCATPVELQYWQVETI